MRLALAQVFAIGRKARGRKALGAKSAGAKSAGAENAGADSARAESAGVGSAEARSVGAKSAGAESQMVVFPGAKSGGGGLPKSLLLTSLRRLLLSPFSLLCLFGGVFGFRCFFAICCLL